MYWTENLSFALYLGLLILVGSLSIAVLFFAISAGFELLCVFLYAFAFPKLAIIKYYRSKAASEGSKTVSADLAAGGIHALPEGVCSFPPNMFD